MHNRGIASAVRRTSHQEAFSSGNLLNRLREEVCPYHSVQLAGIAFQACSIDHSDISPFRINELRPLTNRLIAHVVAAQTLSQILFGFSEFRNLELAQRENCVRPCNEP